MSDYPVDPEHRPHGEGGRVSTVVFPNNTVARCAGQKVVAALTRAALEQWDERLGRAG